MVRRPKREKPEGPSGILFPPGICLSGNQTSLFFAHDTDTFASTDGMTVATANWLKPEEVDVCRNDHNDLCLRVGNSECEKVVTNLTFPYSAPDSYLVFSKDEEEIGILPDLGEVDEDANRFRISDVSALDEESRELLDRCC